MRRLLRVSQLGLVVLMLVFSMGAANTSVRYNDLGHKMMCACGCGQVLIECNHFGCPDSPRMLDELRSAISHGDSDTDILKAFEAKYGATILAAPMFTRFNVFAWFVPPIVLLIGIGATIALVRKWRLRTVDMPPASSVQGFDRIRDQIRKETEL
jgi:cytochrome c-type biogenesis protein CcmH/NrfF